MGILREYRELQYVSIERGAATGQRNRDREGSSKRTAR